MSQEVLVHTEYKACVLCRFLVAINEIFSVSENNRMQIAKEIKSIEQQNFKEIQ